jgi:hypothetical protein
MYKLIANIYLLSFRAMWGRRYSPGGSSDDHLLGSFVLVGWVMFAWAIIAEMLANDHSGHMAIVLYWPVLIGSVRIVVAVIEAE